MPGAYSPDLLFVIPRDTSRAKLNNYSGEKINGFDLWRAYEVSWLNPSGKPEIRTAEFQFSASSLNIIESKSVKQKKDRAPFPLARADKREDDAIREKPQKVP